jgi:hypothetical protein
MHLLNQKLTIFAFLFCVFLTLACKVASLPLERVTGDSSVQAATPDPDAAPVSPTTLPTRALPTTAPTDTPQPTPLPSPGLTGEPSLITENEAPPVKPIPPTPEVNFDDLSLYKPAMRPEFSNDIELVAAAGASRYFIDVIFDAEAFQPGTQVNYSGVERIRYTNTETTPLNAVLFRLYPNLPGFGGELMADSIIVNNESVTPTLQNQDTVLNVPLATPLQPGDHLDLTLFFDGTAYANPQQGYNIFSYANGTLALAGFFPVIAVHDDHGWDTMVPPPYGDATYLDTALYQVNVNVPEQMVVVASGSVADETLHNDGTKTIQLVSGPIRDFYMVIDPTYQALVNYVDGITVTSYYPPELAAGGERALNYSVDALNVFNQKFGPYPYAEFDIVATPTTAGGVEYPGTVVIAERLYDQNGGFFQHAVGHEVAHQWWYGMVGNNQILEPWLDEALTNYSTAIYWEIAEGASIGDQVVNSYFLVPYERARSAGRDRAVLGPVESFSQGEYGTFVYGKGPLFFHALRETYGDDLFFEVMQLYLNNYRYQIASADDLVDTIESVTGQSIQPLVETWLQTP